MYRRDIGILLLSVFAIYWSLQHEGTYQYQKAFYFDLPVDDRLAEEEHVLPAPVVADLNGDGAREVLLVTHALELLLLSPQPAPTAASGSGFGRATLKTRQKVPISSVVLGETQPVALAAGYLDAPDPDHKHARRKMVVVVVTAGWLVLCLDHNLNVLWQKSLHGHFPHHASVRELAVHISHHKVKAADRGLVVVGGTVRYGDLSDDAVAVDADQNDAIDKELQAEETERLHARGAASSVVLGEDGEARPAGGATMIDPERMEVSRGANYFAFEGASGDDRWRNAGSSYRHDLEAMSQSTVPQHNYRLDAAALAERRFGEVSCREYRESVLRVLPHAWGRLGDTRLRAAHFARHRSARGAAKARLAGGRPPPAYKVATSAPVVMFGDSVTVSAVAEDAAAGGGYKGANALVAHTEEGLDVVNLFTGAPICKLWLPPHGLHTDLNADGVLDHVIATSDALHTHAGLRLHAAMQPCNAYVYSGYPARAALFNGTICRGRSAVASALSAGLADLRDRLAPLETAVPVALPAATRDGRYAQSKRRRMAALAVFLNSRGELTAYDARGARRWQRHTQASWTNLHTDRVHARTVPTLATLRMHAHAVPTAVLAAGTHSAVVYDGQGDEMDAFELPEAPTMPLQTVDFTGDGLTDLLLVARGRVYGFQLVRHLGAAAPYATMLGGLLIAVVVVFVMQQGPTAQKRIRSTDRVD